MTPEDLFSRISQLLEQVGIPYMLTGSFASSVYGMSRGSSDIDFILDADEAEIMRLLNQLPENDFYSELNHALEACRQSSTFNMVDSVTGLKIDFILLKCGAFSQEEFRRRRKVPVWETSLYIATAEDIVVSKLEWQKFGKSMRQIEDVAGVLKVQQEKLDLPYIEKWVQELGLASQWAHARRLAGV
ncbi:MAG TPA: hypothetical protein VJW20_14340 [Candidatus Angelobacter sp.]|nr:hypothetical protein [Candidatus Angelobacter sp.]